MELLWIVFITLISVGVAYYAGGYIDRAAKRREAAFERTRRVRHLSDVGHFAHGFAGLMSERTLIAPHMVPAASKALARYVLDACEENADADDWALLCREMELDEKP